VCHSSMLMALYDHHVDGPLWNAFRDMYTDIRSRVKLQGLLSSEFREHQGIRQGGLSSTDLFKIKSNELLDKASKHPMAYRVGTVPVGAPTTADDTALISATRCGAQTLVGIAQQDSNTQRYSFNVQKTKVLTINQKPHVPNPLIELNGAVIGSTEKERHLGIERTPTNSARATVESRIKTCRRSLYSLAGAGLHGYNGLGPMVSLQLLKIYIIPTLIYGLESLILSTEDFRLLESFYKSTLRRLQHLPENTATPAIYLLLGCIPLEGQIHIKVLTFLGSILRRPGTVEHDLIKRQLAHKDLSSKSWVVQVRLLLFKYVLPSVYNLVVNPPGKVPWRHRVCEAVYSYWFTQLKEEASGMKTLQYLDFEAMKPGILASVWMHNSDPLEAHMATVKARLLVQRYPLGYSNYAGAKKADSCVLCQGEEETLTHLLLLCPALKRIRDHHMEKLYGLLSEHSVKTPKDSETFVRLLLSPSTLVPYEVVPLFEQCSRRYIYKLHCDRAAQLGNTKPVYSAVLKSHANR